MQQQVGGNDCGLFAIASARALRNNQDPSKINFKVHEEPFTRSTGEKKLTPFHVNQWLS